MSFVMGGGTILTVVNSCYCMCYFHETLNPGEIKATTQCHLENNVMIGYWYTFEPDFLLGKTSFSAVPEFN